MQMQYVHVGWDLGGTWEDAREGESGILCFTDPPFPSQVSDYIVVWSKPLVAYLVLCKYN